LVKKTGFQKKKRKIVPLGLNRLGKDSAFLSEMREGLASGAKAFRKYCGLGKIVQGRRSLLVAST
jgi:hypothetical protein